MTPSTQSHSESFTLTPTSETARASKFTPFVATRPADILQFIAPAPARVPAPPGYKTMDEIVASFERQPAMRKELSDARRWVTETVLVGKRVTMRTLRLRKGLSQAQLAEAIGTQQPHVARIESGQADLRLETCRRIAHELGVDLNTLDQALQGAGAKAR